MAVPQMPIRWTRLILEVDSVSMSSSHRGFFQLHIFLVSVKNNPHTERQGEGTSRSMPRRQSIENREIKIFQNVKDDLLKTRRLPGTGSAVQHLSEDNAPYAFQFPCQFQVHQHAVNLIWLGIHIFQEEDLALGPNLVGSTQHCREQGQATTRQTSPAASSSQSFEAWGSNALTPRGA